jgi:hypothetical protein
MCSAAEDQTTDLIAGKLREDHGLWQMDMVSNPSIVNILRGNVKGHESVTKIVG